MKIIVQLIAVNSLSSCSSIALLLFIASMEIQQVHTDLYSVNHWL